MKQFKITVHLTQRFDCQQYETRVERGNPFHFTAKSVGEAVEIVRGIILKRFEDAPPNLTSILAQIIINNGYSVYIVIPRKGESNGVS